MIRFAKDLYGQADFIFQQDLATAHTVRSIKICFDAHVVIVLDWPANSPNLNPTENQYNIIKWKMRATRQKRQKLAVTKSIKKIWEKSTKGNKNKLAA